MPPLAHREPLTSGNVRGGRGLSGKFRFFGEGNASFETPLIEQIEAGAIGLKLHEDWGTTPKAIDTCLKVADLLMYRWLYIRYTERGRICREYYSGYSRKDNSHLPYRGSGRGHAPDIIKIASRMNVLPSSTNPTMPFTVNTLDEHLDMLMVCHHLDSKVKEDVAFADSRIGLRQ